MSDVSSSTTDPSGVEREIESDETEGLIVDGGTPTLEVKLPIVDGETPTLEVKLPIVDGDTPTVEMELPPDEDAIEDDG